MNQQMYDVLMWSITIALSILTIGSSFWAVIAMRNMIKGDEERWKDYNKPKIY